MSNRIVGIDYGDKRSGIAISDESNKIAISTEVVETEKLIERLNEIINKGEIDSIVVGIPYSLKGTITAQTEKVIEFSNKLKETFKLKIVNWDERFTTIMAEEPLKYAKKNRKKILKDKISAALILQNYLDYINRKE